MEVWAEEGGFGRNSKAERGELRDEFKDVKGGGERVGERERMEERGGGILFCLRDRCPVRIESGQIKIGHLTSQWESQGEREGEGRERGRGGREMGERETEGEGKREK